jgi:hypothetical protein
MDDWNVGWSTLFRELEPLTDEDLSRFVTIRGEKFRVHEALLRLLAHTSYHVGQIVFLAKWFRGSEWNCLSIPLGKSAEYNRHPTGQRHFKREGKKHKAQKRELFCAFVPLCSFLLTAHRAIQRRFR